MTDEHQHGLEALPLNQPEVTQSRHRRPVGPQERHGAQDGGHGFTRGETTQGGEEAGNWGCVQNTIYDTVSVLLNPNQRE